MQATSTFTFYYMFQLQHCSDIQRKKQMPSPSHKTFTLLSFHPRPPNEPPLPDNTPGKLNTAETLKQTTKKKKKQNMQVSRVGCRHVKKKLKVQ